MPSVQHVQGVRRGQGKEAASGRKLQAIFRRADLDGDGVLNDADNCRFVSNADQLDSDDDDRGDACDSDEDGDGIPNATDNCPTSSNSDPCTPRLNRRS